MQGTCAACGITLTEEPWLWHYRGEALPLCALCYQLSEADKLRACRTQVRAIDQRLAATAPEPKLVSRTDIKEEQIEELLLTGLLDLIQERKLAGRPGLSATHAAIAAWLAVRTGLRVEPAHVSHLTLAMRDAHLLQIGGGGIGQPNFYDTTETEMGLDAYWNQVDAFLLVYRLPGRRQLLLVEAHD